MVGRRLAVAIMASRPGPGMAAKFRRLSLSKPDRLSRFIWYIGLSNVGSGLSYPYVAIYLATRTPSGLVAVGTYFMVVAVVNLATAVALSALRLTVSPGQLGGAGYALLGMAYAALGVASDLPLILIIGACIGVGRGLSSSGVAPFIAQLVPAEQRRDAFARRYWAMNVGLGAGSLSASLLLLRLAPGAMWILMVLNGLSFLPIAGFMVTNRVPPALAKGEVPEAGRAGVPRISVRRLLRLAGPIAIVQLAVNTLGYSQFESTTPLVAHRLSGAGLGFISLIVAANTAAVVTVQRPIVRRLKHGSPRSGMRVAFALWAAAFAVGGATSLLATPVPEVGLLTLGVVFACGEAAYSCSYQPLLLSSVPPQEATRACSLSNAMASVGTSVGPAIGVLLMSTRKAEYVWAVLAAACAAVMILIGQIERADKGATADA